MKFVIKKKEKPFFGTSFSQMAELAIAKITPTYWSLKTHGVSQGMLMEFLACREKARLGYVEGWTSVSVSNAITFGALFHSAMESVYKHLKARKEVTGSTYLANVCQFALAEFKNKTSKERLWTPEDESNHILNMGYLLIMVPAYVANYIEKDKKQRWLIVEDSFQNTFEGVDLKGRYDQVYENQHDEIWIKEMKTKSHFDPYIQDKLSFDFQTWFYLLNYRLEFGKMPTGFVYDMIQRPGLRQGKNETLQRFMGRVKSDVDKTYFQRVRIRVTSEELDQWTEKDFKPVLRDFIAWAEGKTPSYRNPASCETRFGSCRYLKVCGIRDFSGLYQKHHSVLEEKI